VSEFGQSYAPYLKYWRAFAWPFARIEKIHARHALLCAQKGKEKIAEG
jgi:hypothetical protein